MAKGSVIYYFDYMESGNWYEVADLSVFGLKNIFRLAFSPDGNWVALLLKNKQCMNTILFATDFF